MSAIQSTPGLGHVFMDVRPGQVLEFAGTGVRIEVISKSGRASRLRITLPQEVRIERFAAEDSRTKHGTMPSTARG